MIKFIKLKEEHLEKVMSWRVKPEVSSNLNTDVEYNMEEQRRWFNRIDQDDTCRYWMIAYQDVLIGVMNLAAIDRKNLRCSAGYYIGELEYRQLGAMITPYLYNYVFRKMKFKKIYGEVFVDNKNVLKMHKMHGYREVGVYRDHIFKNGCFHDVVLIELLAESWLKQKKFERYIANFN